MSDATFIPPVRAVEGGWKLSFETEERELLVRLLGELEALLADDAGDGATNPLLARLFPPAYPEDEEKEAEYQRLMREELVSSRLAAIAAVRAALGPDAPAVLTENETLAFMQSVNAVRLVLGQMLDITDDDDADAIDLETDDDAPEHHLYGYLSWVLEWTVRSLSPSL